jgi:hypothetical protein
MDNWKDELEKHFKDKKQTKKELKDKKEELKKTARRFIKKTVLPAFDELSKELGRHKRETLVDKKKNWTALMVRHNKKKEFVYEILINAEGEHLLASRSVYSPNEKGKLKLSLEGKIRTPENTARLDKIERADIIADFLESYKQATRTR